MKSTRLGLVANSFRRPLPREIHVFHDYAEWSGGKASEDRVPAGLSSYIRAYLELLEDGSQ